MKVLPSVISVVEVENEGHISLLGKRVTVICAVYIYTGILAGVNGTCIKLTDAHLVYETGKWSDKSYKDSQKLPNDIFVQTAMIEVLFENI